VPSWRAPTSQKGYGPPPIRGGRGRGTGDSVIVILFTARSEASDVEKGYEADADDYIMKPFTLKTLQSRVATALGRATQAAQS
jgi:DNA-binding response OmpR family regulator